MRIRTPRSKLMLLFMAFAMVLALPATAFADQVTNTLDTDIDSTYEVMAVDKGASKSTTLYVNQDSVGKSGCDFTGNKTLKVSVNTSNAAVATVSPSNITFSNCNTVHKVTVTGVGEGSANITLTQTYNDTGYRIGLDTARFTVNVSNPPPANTAPQVSLNGVEGGKSYEKGSVPAATCDVVDAEDGNKSFAAALSGTLDANGYGSQTATCSYTDAGGLTETVSETYSITETKAPSSQHALSDPANANDWHKQNVTVNLSATDNQGGSGVKEIRYSINNGAEQVAVGSSKAILVDSEGTTSISYYAVDNFNNAEGPANIATVKLDKTAPGITNDGPTTGANSNGWYNTNVTNNFSASDTLSGLANPADASITKTTTGEGRALTVSSGNVADAAGNVAPSIDSRGFNVDKTAPTNVAGTPDRAPNANGWYNSAVTVSFAGDDALSGIANCSTDTYNGPDNASASVGGSCRDLAGNSANGSFGLKYDANAPTLSPSVSPNPVLLNGNATATAGAQDNLSGVASEGCDPVNTSSVGAKSVSCSATDEAGNQRSASASYNVNYRFAGFRAPVDNGGIFNSVKAGQSVPMKFSLSGNQGLSIIETGFPKVAAVTCPNSTTMVDQIEQTTTANSGLTYDATADQYNYVWKTQSTYAGKCFRFDMKLIDGTTQSALFKFTK